MKKRIVLILAGFLCALVGCSSGTAESEPGGSGREAVIEISGADEAVLSTQAGPEGSSAASSASAPDLTGPWHLDPERNDLTAISEVFDGSAEFGAILEIGSNGQLRWQIGAEGGDGTFDADGAVLTAELNRTVDGSSMTTVFDVLRDGDEVYLGMHWADQVLFWIWGDDGSTHLSGD